MLIFSISFPRLINFITLWIPLKEGLRWKEAQRQGDFTDNFNIYTYTSQNIYTGCVSVCDKYLHWPRVSVRKKIYTLQQDKCKCKKFGHLSVNDLHLHWIYRSYVRLLRLYMHNTGIKLQRFRLPPKFPSGPDMYVKTKNYWVGWGSYPWPYILLWVNSTYMLAFFPQLYHYTWTNNPNYTHIFKIRAEIF